MPVRLLQEVQKVAKKLHSVAYVMLSHTSHIDQGGCGYNNFDCVSVARLKVLTTEQGLRDKNSGLEFWFKGSELEFWDKGSELGFWDEGLGLGFLGQRFTVVLF